jgi:hypothetical protein
MPPTRWLWWWCRFINGLDANVGFTPLTKTSGTIAEPFTCRTAVFLIVGIKFALRIPGKKERKR